MSFVVISFFFLIVFMLIKDDNFQLVTQAYRIYSIKRPGRLLNFWTLRVGAYSRWAFIRGWALIKFLPFSASSKFILQQNNK